MGRQGHGGAKRPNGGADMALLGGLLQPPQVAPHYRYLLPSRGIPRTGRPNPLLLGQEAIIPGDDGINRWKEKVLVMIDAVNRCLSYELLENNIGFKSYVSTFTVGSGGGRGKIQW
ncbi:hypothetical protein SLA2020_218320 [Shorea laevis]